jgi:hypothetical protein
MSDAKKAFMTLSQTEKFETLFDMLEDAQRNGRNDRAIQLRRNNEFNSLIAHMQGELEGIGRRKNQSTTTEKMTAVMNKSFLFVVARYWIERVMPTTFAILQNIIILWILIHAFGEQLVKP